MRQATPAGARTPAVTAMATATVARNEPRRHATTSAAADLTSRFFAPAVRIPEDPVTGSAHCVLGPSGPGGWVATGCPSGRGPLVCHRASARGGVVRVHVRGDRTELGGRAVTILEGRLALSPRGQTISVAGCSPRAPAPA